MPAIAIIFGILLDALGIVSFVMTGSAHVTALIPSFIGSVIFVCGVLAYAKPGIRKHVMHVAALLGLLGAVGGLGRALPKLGSVLAGTAPHPIAVWASLALGIISLIFLVFCVKSFVDARLARAQGSKVQE